MALPTYRDRLPGTVGAVLLIGALLRIWHFAGGRSLWADEAMVALNIIHLSPRALLGPLHFDQIAPAGWLLLEQACLYLWSDFDYSLRLPSLLGGLAALFLFYRFLKYSGDAAEALAGAAMMALFPVFIQYGSMVKPYILDVLFSVALLYASLALLRAQGDRVKGTAIYCLLGILCIPLSFGGTLAMAGTGTTLFVASVTRKAYPWSLALVAVGIVWGLLFWAIYSLSYAHNDQVVSNMTDVFWTRDFAPIPTSLQELNWYAKSAAHTIAFLMTTDDRLMIAVIWIYGAVRLARREPWLLALLISPIVATLIASMPGLYPFHGRLILGLAPSLIVGVSCGAVGIVRQFPHRSLATLAMAALLGFTPIKQTIKGAVAVPPFPMQEIKPNLAYLKRHYRDGDQVIMFPRAERAFALYAERFGLVDLEYKLTSNFSVDPTCVYGDVRLIEDEPRAWLLFYHVTRIDRPILAFLEEALGHSGSLRVAHSEAGSHLYLYEAKSGTQRMRLPPSAEKCSRPPKGKDFLERIMRRLRAGETETGTSGR